MNKTLRTACLAVLIAASGVASAQADSISLDPYLMMSESTPQVVVSYSDRLTGQMYVGPRRLAPILPPPSGFSPNLLFQLPGGGVDNTAVALTIGMINRKTDTFLNNTYYGLADLCGTPAIPLRGIALRGESLTISLTIPLTINTELTTGQQCVYFGEGGPLPVYTATYRRPSLVGALGLGSDWIESVGVQIGKNGQPWIDYEFVYRLGLVRMDSRTFQTFKGFSMNRLPPPAVEGTVVEYRNTQDFPQSPGGHFFYSSDPVEQASVDAGQAGKFERTGRSFNAGGYLPVCRFYGSVSPGPNSHFFSAMPEECALLKSLQRTYIAPSTEPQWNSEGNGFYTVAPLTDAQGQKTCLAGTQPVHRAYNNAFPVSGPRNPWDSNHRFSTQRADIDELVQRYGWRDEGVVFCAPLSASSASQ